MGSLNDLWNYDPGTGNWTWMKGSTITNQVGTYGTLGIAASGNTPGARRLPTSWTDSGGNLWLFGGTGYGASGNADVLNDLWKYDRGTGNWTWMKGASSTGQTGTFGTMGTPAAGNTPGAREGALSWTDAAGSLWLFGGMGYAGAHGYLHDLWKYDPTSGCWTWMKGSFLGNQSGVFGTLGTPGAANTPGGCAYAVSWTDLSGCLWLFGGYGYAADGGAGYLGALWKYEPPTGNWTWMNGSSINNQRGTYGTLGTPAPGNTPGARVRMVSWTGASGALWLFGG